MIDGWEREAALALAVLAIARSHASRIGTQQFRRQTGDRVESKGRRKEIRWRHRSDNGT